jgi:colanic acid/amylovoran biosynthesis glycosyltransferase
MSFFVRFYAKIISNRNMEIDDESNICFDGNQTNSIRQMFYCRGKKFGTVKNTQTLFWLGIMSTSEPTELILLPSLKATRGPRGGLVLTEKYLNGAAMFAKNWPGQVTSLVQLDTVPTTDMDHIEILPGEAKTNVELRPESKEGLTARLQSAAIALVFLSPNEMLTAQICQSLGLPVVFISEYSPQTERQMVECQTRNPILRWRRNLWNRQAEKLRLKMLLMAAGLQCSGTPTYEHYQGLTQRNLLFFDNRVSQEKVISDDEFARKTSEMAAEKPLRLVFGGRLVSMKGVQDLPRFAKALQDRKVPFTLDIYGCGPLETSLEQQIQGLELSNIVRLCGARDFETGWLPILKQQVDLFICCHPQGDPSCTYPEVMSCGVPIAGYDNEAFCGIVAHSQGGWLSPSHDLDKLADTVARLHKDRVELIATAGRARAFAKQHAFELTMARRTAHLIETSRLPELLRI